MLTHSTMRRFLRHVRSRKLLLTAGACLCLTTNDFAQNTKPQSTSRPPTEGVQAASSPSAIDTQVSNGTGKLRVRVAKSGGVDFSHPAFGNKIPESATRYDPNGVRITAETFDSIVILYEFLAPDVRDLKTFKLLSPTGSELNLAEFGLFGQIHLDVPKALVDQELSLVFVAESGAYPPIKLRVGALATDPRKYPHLAFPR